ncbi:PhnD/SsuA/transferrin family substrate-binding protein [Arcobacter roscoffensis]|uniref:Phosphate/phosphite/phosphonate ABC transporter substrate-binding protein n=1 Tax=Arcobacter roscoffensis TaxID=2961520 RepID=A0ABY5E7G1_9BACT|nr:PhnD/SsuA/transferrin family substrate-binding protein [Arcobacter roscoffensis]UTJ07093.1 phosphate/phosphite/phosphonate ABC transporter substrate-binding protein [Arcobacter roscoffensis]
MKLIFKIFLTILLLNINLNANEKKYEFSSTFGFLQTGTILNRFKDARVAMKVWLEDIASSYGGDLSLKFYDSNNTLYKDFVDHRVDMIVLNLPYYFINREKIDKDAIDFWSIAMSKDRYIKYYLISSKNSKINNFNDIKGKSISITSNDTVGNIWIDKKSLQTFRTSYKNIFSEIHPVLKESTALLNVFFKKRDLAVVTKKTWDTMVELNPSIKNKIKIIDETKENHLPFIGFFSKYADKRSIDAFFELSANLRDLKGSSQVIDLLKFESIFKVKEESLIELENYYKEYDILKKRYE